MNIVSVNIPKVIYDSVIFSWHSSKKVPFFKKNSFYIKYKDINIEKLPIEYLWYAFLSIMIPIYTYCDEDVVFKFPKPVPTKIAELWVNYHNGKNIHIEPLADIEYGVFHESNEMDTKVGILFGGGKDSTYALSVLNEIYGPKNIVILSYVLPYMDNIMQKHDRRRDVLLINPIKDKMKINVQKIYTNFYANLTDLKYKYSTHLAIYFGTMLPVLLYYKISLVTFSYEFISYLTGYYNSNEIELNYKRSRPEYNNYLAEHTSNIINKPLNIVNFNHYISEIGSFKLLANRYPERLKNLLMCENISDMKRWCLNCKKCGTYVLLSMCYGNKYIGIDLNSFFENSGYIKKLIKTIDNYKYQRNEDNNYPWVKEFCSRFHYESHCHVIAIIDIEKYRKVLSAKAFNNLNKIKDSYGNKKYPIHECFIEPAFRQVSPPLPEAIREIVTRYCPAEEVLPDYFLVEKTKRTIDYKLKASIPDVFKRE